MRAKTALLIPGVSLHLHWKGGESTVKVTGEVMVSGQQRVMVDTLLVSGHEDQCDVTVTLDAYWLVRSEGGNEGREGGRESNEKRVTRKVVPWSPNPTPSLFWVVFPPSPIPWVQFPRSLPPTGHCNCKLDPGQHSSLHSFYNSGGSRADHIGQWSLKGQGGHGIGLDRRTRMTSHWSWSEIVGSGIGGESTVKVTGEVMVSGQQRVMVDTLLVSGHEDQCDVTVTLDAYWRRVHCEGDRGGDGQWSAEGHGGYTIGLWTRGPV
ncbi:hypothetical protein Pmani_001853 [Petrolisthes manimaculis]|uniref:Uncharacterized protein n=1 Tax=Petrolisthes manimaculis TaxID=1843537 RepID=A0AAE1QM82_9EUCA|nr:hypothetical protein Pmani_001853 [Petrolisthes manimaculis]